MGRYLLLWLLGVPIPILLLIWAFGGLHWAAGCGVWPARWARLGDKWGGRARAASSFVCCRRGTARSWFASSASPSSFLQWR